jgi:hemerythrin-like domain-containing protein
MLVHPAGVVNVTEILTHVDDVLFAPPINVDSLWLLVKKLVEYEMQCHNTDDEPIYFDPCDPEAFFMRF